MNHMEEDVSNRTLNSQSDGLHERGFDVSKCTGGIPVGGPDSSMTTMVRCTPMEKRESASYP